MLVLQKLSLFVQSYIVFDTVCLYGHALFDSSSCQPIHLDRPNFPLVAMRLPVTKKSAWKSHRANRTANDQILESSRARLAPSITFPSLCEQEQTSTLSPYALTCDSGRWAFAIFADSSETLRTGLTATACFFPTLGTVLLPCVETFSRHSSRVDDA